MLHDCSIDFTSTVSIIISLLAGEEDFNFRPPSSLAAPPSHSPFSFGTIRHRRRSSRSPGGISLISYDNNNGDESGGRGGRRRRRRRSRKDEENDDDNGDQAPCRACEKQPYRSGIAHGSRRGFRIIVVEHACTSLYLSYSLIIPFRFLRPCVGPRQCRQGVRVGSRQDYPVNNAPNSSQDLSCIIAKLFRSRFPVGVPFRLL